MIDKHLLSFIKELRNVNSIIDKCRSGWRLSNVVEEKKDGDEYKPGKKEWQSYWKWNEDFKWTENEKGAWIHAGYGDVSATRDNELIMVNGDDVVFGTLRGDEHKAQPDRHVLLKKEGKGYVTTITPLPGLSNPFLSGERGFYVSDRVIDAVMKQVFENKYEKRELNENTIKTEMSPLMTIINNAMTGEQGLIKTDEELKSAKLKRQDKDLQDMLDAIQAGPQEEAGAVETNRSENDDSKLRQAKVLMAKAIKALTPSKDSVDKSNTVGEIDREMNPMSMDPGDDSL